MKVKERWIKSGLALLLAASMTGCGIGSSQVPEESSPEMEIQEQETPLAEETGDEEGKKEREESSGEAASEEQKDSERQTENAGIGSGQSRSSQGLSLLEQIRQALEGQNVAVNPSAPGSAAIPGNGAGTKRGTSSGSQKPSNSSKEEEKETLPDGSYSLVWSEEFDGTELDSSAWSYEVHEPGWVNSELQAYVDSRENAYISEGNLIIQPIKNEDGTYTSGRVNTNNKQTFKYGYVEARVKVPTGKGFLPAFWMMPENENLYGQWPKCGEIDIMEVMGQDTTKLYGTLHYGEPHAESQGTKVLTEGSFSDEYHVFAIEWLPGVIRWYCDGELYHEENDWYSTKPGVGTVSYPAPFDQPFYIIFNVAVGGSWVGYPDETTTFGEEAQMAVDYVRVYQKDSYDEDVEKPVKEVVLRDPDATGNYVKNGDFAVAESLSDAEDWKFMTALGGVASAEITDNTMVISTENPGTVDYSVQLVQAGIPLEKGATYTVSFDAKADAARDMNVAVKAPDRGYIVYLSDNGALTTEFKNYTYTFKMTQDSDANGRLEYNMGAKGSDATIYIQNVKIEKTIPANPNEVEEKTIRADGNLVYNGEFQEGTKRLGYWEVSDETAVVVTNINNARELLGNVNHTAENPLILSQTDLAFSEGTNYAFTFQARAVSGNPSLQAVYRGQVIEIPLTLENQTFRYSFGGDTASDNNIAFYFSGQGQMALDHVSIVEDSLIKNGSFNAGLSGWELFVDNAASATVVCDSLTEENAADVTINSTGNTDWYIQLKQNDVTLEENQWYRLKFDIKSNLARRIMYTIQGGEAKGWDAYAGTQKLDLAGDSQYISVSHEFQMRKETDTEAMLSITLGAVDGIAIGTQHRLCFDNVSLEKIEGPSEGLDQGEASDGKDSEQDSPAKEPLIPENMLTGLNAFACEDAVADITQQDGTYTFNITTTGTKEWGIQFVQNGIRLDQGQKYILKFKIQSEKDQLIKVCVRETASYQGEYRDLNLEASKLQEMEYEFTWLLVDQPAGGKGEFSLQMGTMTVEGVPISVENNEITISDVSLVPVLN